jgi:aryl-alcohol dehydrogenase-like predicted oxidoreductase
MIYRKLGKTNLNVSEIGFGCWQIGGGWGKQDDKLAIESLERAYNLGINFFDTALGYGDGHSEELLAKVFDKKREKIIITTKVPPKNFSWPALESESIKNTFPKDWIIKCANESLQNLKTDYIDVLLLHAWADRYLEETEWLEAFLQLKKEGKIRSFGVSVNDWDPYNSVRLIESDLIDVVEVIYNIFEQRPDEKLLPAAMKHNVGIIARVPFEEGLLTGKYNKNYKFEKDDWRGEWLMPERLEIVSKKIKRLEKFLDKDTPDLTSLALKFILSNPAVSTTIPGMKKIEYVDKNVEVMKNKLLSKKVLSELKKEAFNYGWKYPWSQE